MSPKPRPAPGRCCVCKPNATSLTNRGRQAGTKRSRSSCFKVVSKRGPLEFTNLLSRSCPQSCFCGCFEWICLRSCSRSCRFEAGFPDQCFAAPSQLGGPRAVTKPLKAEHAFLCTGTRTHIYIYIYIFMRESSSGVRGSTKDRFFLSFYVQLYTNC